MRLQLICTSKLAPNIEFIGVALSGENLVHGPVEVASGDVNRNVLGPVISQNIRLKRTADGLFHNHVPELQQDHWESGCLLGLTALTAWLPAPMLWFFP